MIYRLKVLAFLLSTSFLYQSCLGQSFDLEKLVLPVKQTELKELSLTSSGAGVGTESVQYTSYFSDAADSGKLLVRFGGITIQPAADEKYHTESRIRVYGKQNGNVFEGYRLYMDSPENFDAVISYLLKNKNTFRLVFDNGDEKTERARVFTDEQNQITYLVLSLQQKGHKAGYLEAISNQEEPLLEARLGGAFGYYKEYLEYRKHKSADFSYLDFLKERDNDIYTSNNNLK